MFRQASSAGTKPNNLQEVPKHKIIEIRKNEPYRNPFVFSAPFRDPCEIRPTKILYYFFGVFPAVSVPEFLSSGNEFGMKEK